MALHFQREIDCCLSKSDCIILHVLPASSSQGDKQAICSQSITRVHQGESTVKISVVRCFLDFYCLQDSVSLFLMHYTGFLPVYSVQAYTATLLFESPLLTAALCPVRLFFIFMPVLSMYNLPQKEVATLILTVESP